MEKIIIFNFVTLTLLIFAKEVEFILLSNLLNQLQSVPGKVAENIKIWKSMYQMKTL